MNKTPHSVRRGYPSPLAAVCAWLVLSITATATYAQPAASRPTGASREKRLWASIATLAEPAPTTQPFESWFKQAQQRRRELVRRVRLYLSAYPGGGHRDQAIKLELTALFELGTLEGGALTELRRRLDALIRNPPSVAALHEAAYWALLCRRGTARSPASQPASRPTTGLDDELRAAYREYVIDYPQSRYVPRLARLLFDDAAVRSDVAAMRDVVTRLQASFPEHVVTTTLEARLRRRSAVGKPFWPALRTVDGRELRRADFVGRPTLIVVWAAFSDSAVRCVDEIERLRAQHPDLVVIGLGLDETADQTVAAARAAGLDWPQCNDGLGWGGEFVRSWGVGELPFSFAIDGAGRLVGSAAGKGWRELALRIVGGERDPE